VERLAERILFLKGDVEMVAAGPVEKITDAEKTLKRAAEMEHEAVGIYNECALKCSQNSDAVSEQMFEGLVADEERHFDQFDKQLDNIKRFGPNYLALQSFNKGAAGGLGAGAVALMNARIVPGADAVIRAAHLEADLDGADWMITGEGKFDSQSLHGKVVSAIAQVARRHDVQVAVLAGTVEVSNWQRAGIHYARPIALGVPLPEAMQRAPELLAAAARQFAEAL